MSTWKHLTDRFDNIETHEDGYEWARCYGEALIAVAEAAKILMSPRHAGDNPRFADNKLVLMAALKDLGVNAPEEDKA